MVNIRMGNNCFKKKIPISKELVESNTASLQEISNDPYTVDNELVVIYDYDKGSDSEITIKRGDKVTVIGDGNEEWVYCKNNNTGEEGFVPKNFVKYDSTGLLLEEWYHDIPRLQAQQQLMTPYTRVGTFIVRPSESTRGEFTLSLKVDQPESSRRAIVKHFKIRQQAGQFHIQLHEKFDSVSELLAHYKRFGFVHPILYPYRNAKPTRFDLSMDTRDQFEVDRQYITFNTKLGEGNFGEVWHGHYQNGTEIAIKTLKEGKMSKEAFLKEAMIMKSLKHDNILVLYNICSSQEPIYIITEYMSRGSLIDVLRSDDSIDFTNLVYIAYQVASGMAYLECKKLIHRDLSARNVLVQDELKCKVADFGLARIIVDEEYSPTSNTKFPVKWTAPESITHYKFSIKSDVWSYGVLLYEVFTKGGVPYPGFSNREVIERIRHGYRMSCPPGVPERIYNLMCNCWHRRPEDRYTFATLENEFSDYNDSSQYCQGDGEGNL